MPRESSLRPTLWRTCRVLANAKRLAILSLLAHESPQTVSSVAWRLGLRVAVASQYLRALEARSLLSVRRLGRAAEYRLRTAAEGRHPLVEPIRAALRRNSGSAKRIFRLCTAFTHPRRIQIFRVLRKGPRTVGQLRAATHISALALHRHLEKLTARGFVKRRADWLAAAVPSAAVACALATLAEE